MYKSAKITCSLSFLKSQCPREIVELIKDKDFYLQRSELNIILNSKLYNEKENIVNSQEIFVSDLILLINTLLLTNLKNQSEFFLKTFDALLEGVRKKLDIKGGIEKTTMINFIVSVLVFRNGNNVKNHPDFSESFLKNIDYVLKSIILFIEEKLDLNPNEELTLNFIRDHYNLNSQQKSSKDEEPLSEIAKLKNNLTGDSQSLISVSTEDKNKENRKEEGTEVITNNENEEFIKNKGTYITAEREVITKNEKQEFIKNKGTSMNLEKEDSWKTKVVNKKTEDEKPSLPTNVNIGNIGSNTIVMINANINGNDNLNITKYKINNEIKFDLTKNFSKKFSDYFSQNKVLNKSNIHKKVDKIMKEYYETETKLSQQNYNNLEITKLIYVFKSMFNNYDIYSIGSTELKISTNYCNRTFTPDILFITKDPPIKETEFYENIEKCRNNEFEFNQLIRDNSKTNNYKCILNSIRNKQTFNVRIIHQDEIMLLTQKVLYKIFIEENFRKLHVFVQEIFFNHFKIADTRFHISCLIVAYLTYKFPNSERLSIITTKVIKKEGKLLGKKQTNKDEAENYCYDFREEDLKSFKSPSDTLFEFFDFVKRYLNYNKLAIAQELNPKNPISFKSIEDDYLTFLNKGLLEDQNYLFNLNFLKEKLKDRQKGNFYSPKGEQLSKLLFCMIDNSEKLDVYKNVLTLTEQILSNNK